MKNLLEKKIEEILRHYWWEHYGKEAYIKNCTKKLLELISETHEAIYDDSDRTKVTKRKDLLKANIKTGSNRT